MSFATSERIVCIFARSALRNATTSSITSSEPLPVLDASSRWRRRNYSVAIQRTGVFDSSYIQDMGPGERYVGDGSCWMIDCSGVDKMQRPPELPVVNCTWRVSLVGKRTVPDTLRVRLDFDVSSHGCCKGISCAARTLRFICRSTSAALTKWTRYTFTPTPLPKNGSQGFEMVFAVTHS